MRDRPGSGGKRREGDAAADGPENPAAGAHPERETAGEGDVDSGRPQDPVAEEHQGRAASDRVDAEDEERPRGRRERMLRGALAGALAVGVVVFMAVLGVLNPPRELGVGTDRLGPDRAEPVAGYLVRARDSLSGADTEPHWALVSFTEPITPQAIPAHSGGLRIGQVLHRVPIPGVQTPLVSVAVPAGDAVAVASADAAAWQIQDQLERTGAIDERYPRVMTVSMSRLRAGCACTVGLVVRGTLPELRNLASVNGIRAVEALPADAVAGHFAVSPLLPEYIETVVPGPDDAPVPDN
ncbi:hypothetical protein [Nocardia lijiangensis]|uniref:hypothetical protein n=1 Tax=Nocardia lijiangensis TaxID=299618 RepID=UPI000ADC9FFB|nr:hypothetical protein [Nocardia lijiangensis]